MTDTTTDIDALVRAFDRPQTGSDPVAASPKETRIAVALQERGFVSPDAVESTAQVDEALTRLREFRITHGLAKSLAYAEAHDEVFGGRHRKSLEDAKIAEGLQAFQDTGKAPAKDSPEFDAWCRSFYGPDASKARQFAKQRTESMNPTARKEAEKLLDATEFYPDGKGFRQARADETPEQKRAREIRTEVEAADRKTLKSLRDEVAKRAIGDEGDAARWCADRLMRDPSTADLVLQAVNAKKGLKPRVVAQALHIVRETRATLAAAPRLLAELQKDVWIETAKLAKHRDEQRGAS